MLGNSLKWTLLMGIFCHCNISVARVISPEFELNFSFSVTDFCQTIHESAT